MSDTKAYCVVRGGDGSTLFALVKPKDWRLWTSYRVDLVRVLDINSAKIMACNLKGSKAKVLPLDETLEILRQQN